MPTNIEAERTNIAGKAIEIADDRHDNTLRIMSSSIERKNSFLKDISNACLAILGTSITLLTVGQGLIESKTLLITGSAVIAATYVMTFICRRHLDNYLVDLTDFLHTQRLFTYYSSQRCY